MDTKQLLTFTTLAETLNYQRAAERLQYAPSSLFRHIQLLEDELGTVLFYKDGRQLQLTEDGKRLLPDAQHLLAGWQSFLSSAQQCSAAQAVSVGGCEMNTSYSLVLLLQRFAESFADTRYSMTTSPNAAVPDLLRTELIDVGFYYSTGTRRPQGLAHIPLYREPLYPCSAPGNPLRGQTGLHWKDLAGVDIVHPHDNCCFISEYRERMRAQGLPLGRTSFLGGISLVAEHASREKALMLVPLHSLPRMREDFDVLPLEMDEEPLTFWESVLFRSSESLTPAARRLIHAAVEYAKDEAEKAPGVLSAPPSYDSYLSGL